MKKILVVFDGAHFPAATLDFVRSLNFEEPVFLTGIFLPSVDYAELSSYYYYGTAIPKVYLDEYEDDAAAIAKNIALFEDFCSKKNFRYHIHKDIKRKVIKELQYETRYADLLILSSSLFYENLGELTQEQYLEETLHKAECPVVLLPGDYMEPERIIFTYDGSASAMFAIKQFIYLFPHLTDLDALFVHADVHQEDMPALSSLKEYAQQHFSRLAYYHLGIDARKYLNAWIENKGAAMVVSGAYSRSSLSQFFKKSFMQETISEQRAPLFIAHP